MNALDLLTADLFDYAGTFPPASLPFKEALAESARAARLVRHRILGTDIVVASADLKLVTDKALEQAGFGDTRCTIALVGIDEAALKRTIPRILKFNAKNTGSSAITSLEIHGKRFDAKQLQAAATALGDVRLFVEPHMTDRAWAGSGAGLVTMLGRLKAAGTPVGLKVRGSGPHAVSRATLAWLIPQIVAVGIPFKATAGLHHPIVEAAQGNHIGFVNLAAALRLHQALGPAFDDATIQACLAESAADAYSFDGELAWRGHVIDEEALAKAMADVPFAIGSCSLSDPDEDMLRLFGPPA